MARSNNSNIFTGIRKLGAGKKSSKKSSKKPSKKNIPKKEEEEESTHDSSISEGMMELLEDDEEEPVNNNKHPSNEHDEIQHVDPLTVLDQVKTDKFGKQIYNNRIGELLGGSEFNNLANLYTPPSNQYYSPISTVQNNLQPEYNQLAQNLMSPQMSPVNSMMNQMPMNQMHMNQMSNNNFANLAKLSN